MSPSIRNIIEWGVWKFGLPGDFGDHNAKWRFGNPTAEIVKFYFKNTIDASSLKEKFLDDMG